jgi:hypothetical protein
MSENLLHEIRNDLVSSTSFSNTLRKTLVLAHRLQSATSLIEWVRNELNGYKGQGDLPDYRVIPCSTYVDYFVGQYIVHNVPVDFQADDFQLMRVREGTKALEELLENSNSDVGAYLTLAFEPPLFEVLAGILWENEGKKLIKAERRTPLSSVAQIVDSAKNRLLDFVLELDNLAEFSGGGIQIDHLQVPRLFQQIIMGNANISVKESDRVNIFDQRGQNVNYQYNAARDINFAQAQNRFQLVEELEKLQDEIAKTVGANLLGEDVAIEADYEIRKAVQQAKSDGGSSKVIEHLAKLKALVSGVNELIDLSNGITGAIEAARRLLA